MGKKEYPDSCYWFRRGVSTRSISDCVNVQPTEEERKKMTAELMKQLILHFEENRFLGDYHLSIRWKSIRLPLKREKAANDYVWLMLAPKDAPDARRRVLVMSKSYFEVCDDEYDPADIVCHSDCKLRFRKYWRLPDEILERLSAKKVCFIGMGRFAELMTESEYAQEQEHTVQSVEALADLLSDDSDRQ